jgi:V/A-type H+-transporting ATPase subunit K
MQIVIVSILVALVVLYLLILSVVRRLRHPVTILRSVIGGLLSLNGLVVLTCIGVVLSLLIGPTPVLAQQGSTSSEGLGGAALGAALATGLACIGAGIAVGIAGAAAIGGITEKPEILGRTLIFVGLAEGIAIYGLIIAFMILSR